MTSKQTPADIVIAHYGVRPLARRLGIAPSTVQRWRERNNIPTDYHVRLIQDSGGAITADDLVFGR